MATMFHGVEKCGFQGRLPLISLSGSSPAYSVIIDAGLSGKFIQLAIKASGHDIALVGRR